MEKPEALRNKGLEQIDAGVVMMGLMSEPYGPNDTDDVQPYCREAVVDIGNGGVRS
jgi:hypothetical protein